MSLEQKIAQLIMPAIRSWEGDENAVTDLSAVPELATALARHQYGGVILFGSNVVETEQTYRLVNDLQSNNARSADATSTSVIPYFVAADQEGGSVARLSMGTRGTGSMALGATGENAAQNARDTGTVFGLELSALGINVNLAPCVDVITNLADPGMSTRVFSDDPQLVADCGNEFAYGVDKCGVVTCFKHFPGAGDGSDDPTAIMLTEEQLREQGLFAFSSVIENGANMVMTSACTFPALDDEVTLADGTTKGYYPATMSPKIVDGMLRGEMGFDGVVMTDALEMAQFFDEPETSDAILPGGRELEGCVNVAEKCIAAGCDILLIPTDLNSASKAQWYEDYIAGIAQKVASGAISEQRIDDSVRRILNLKEMRGILCAETGGGESQNVASGDFRTGDSDAENTAAQNAAQDAAGNVGAQDAGARSVAAKDIATQDAARGNAAQDVAVRGAAARDAAALTAAAQVTLAEAKARVGSVEHHDIERNIAEQAVTLLKNDGVLPLPGENVTVAILGRATTDVAYISAVLAELTKSGAIDADARIENNVAGTTSGVDEAATSIYVGYYYDMNNGALAYADANSKAIAQAQYVVCLSATGAGLDALQDSDACMQGISRAMREAREAGAKFVLLSNSLPVDAARFADADAIVCSYLSAGLAVDPVADGESDTMHAINANVPAALRAIFGAADMPGTLPINVRALKKGDDGAWAYTDEVLFPRGSSAR